MSIKIKQKPSTVEKVWQTEAGFKAAVVLVRGQHRCGYVAVGPEHPLHGLSYSESTPYLADVSDEEGLGKRSPIIMFAVSGRDSMRSMDIAFDVHGGVTFADTWARPDDGKERETDQLDTGDWWIGFDCAHSGDGSYPPEDEDGNILGYPYHFSDGPVRELDYVVAECESLAMQIKTKCLAERKLIGNEGEGE
ncbi:hypothetical protein D3C78_509910 [compost metagenome]